jgi:hypothetical protein
MFPSEAGEVMRQRALLWFVAARSSRTWEFEYLSELQINLSIAG